MSKKSNLSIIEEMLDKANVDFETEDSIIKTASVSILFDDDGNLIDLVPRTYQESMFDEDEDYVDEDEEVPYDDDMGYESFDDDND